MHTFQESLKNLSAFWEKQGCIIHQGYDLEVGAGTFNPATFLRCLGPEPYRAAYIEPCRRPTDGRYGTNPNRLQHYFQYQVILKPSPSNIQDLYLHSLEALGFDLKEHDIRFVHDDWESPTIGAWGLGWEVWMDGMEVTQFTYFQAVGGIDLKPITGEITYGIERLSMYLQKVNSIFDLQWNETLTYGDLYHRNEVEWSYYNFEKASTNMWKRHFEDYEEEAKILIIDQLPIPAYDFIMKASHAFNLLDARGAISVTERTGYIGRLRTLARQVAETYLASREKQGYPLLQKSSAPETTPLSPDSPPHLSENLSQARFDQKDNYLLEIGSEELPASFVSIGSQNLKKGMEALLEKEKLSFEKIEAYATPRRLAVYVQGLPMATPTRIIERKGPPIEQIYDSKGALKATGEGFFRSIERTAPSLEALQQGKAAEFEIRSIKGVPYLIAHLQQKGRPTAALLQDHLPFLIQNLEFPKKMRWGDLAITYARPLHWILSLFGKDVIPFRFGPLEAGRRTYGHRQLDPGSFELENAQDYLEVLHRHFVLVDLKERRQSIHQQLDVLEKELKCVIIERERVIPQVMNLVESPFLTAGSFKQEFLRVPKEVLISEMIEHQKYFPVADEKGILTNQFVMTVNTKPTEQIRQGNQRVLSARLSDGVFLYEEDLKCRLEDFNEKLKKVIFQKELGTVYQKVERIVAGAESIQQSLQISSLEQVKRAALLCKADLASHMVYEFPELQGIMGRYYALAQKEDKEVAQAIEEHWMPRGEEAALPETETGIVISLADKFDNLLGCFLIGLKPTSSSDPYALRRQVLGLIKMLIRGRYSLSLTDCLRACAKSFPSCLLSNQEAVINEILGFVTNRVKTVFQEYGFAKDEIEASLADGGDDLYDIFCRVKALHDFRLEAKEQFASLYEVYKRAKGQLNGYHGNIIKAEWLVEPAEKQLQELLDQQQEAFQQALSQGDYPQVYRLIALIQPALAHLFDQVKILADERDVRENRLALLRRVFNLFGEILDFSKIQEKT